MDKKIYKNLIIIGVIILAIIGLVFIIRSKSGQSVYTGFLEPKQGAWSEIMNGAEDLQKIVYLGERNIQNVPSYGVEIQSVVSKGKSGNTIVQIWRNVKTDEIVEIVSKIEGKKDVICVDKSLMQILLPTFNISIPAIKTPEQYNPKNKYVYDSFTTKTGKIIQVAKFIDENNVEIWLSSEVPFGIVKVIKWVGEKEKGEGEVIAWLQDFGLEGGYAEISETQMNNCKRIFFPNLSR